jgi:DNA-binding beta-propeller fold protein YncE
MSVNSHPGWVAATVLAVVATALACMELPASAATGFGEIGGPGGCLSEPGVSGGAGCREAAGVFRPKAIAVSPDGTNVYVVGGVSGSNIAESFGTIAILKRNPTTGEIADTGCLSSDGTDGRGTTSARCTQAGSLLGADGVTVSHDGKTVFVTAHASASVVAFARDTTTGALTRLGCFQSAPRPDTPCTPANMFLGSDDLLTSADDSALYVASPVEGTISAFTAPPAAASTSTGASTSVATSTPAGASTPSTEATTGAAGAKATPAELDSLFTPTPGGFTANPCIAVNGYEGECAVGVAMKGVNDLTLSPEGNQLYAVAPTSHAIDSFTAAGKAGLAQTGCLVSGAAGGVCSTSSLLQSPSALMISPDGKNAYVADTSPGGDGRIDILVRNAATGQLTDSSCVDFLPQPPKPEPGEEHEEEEEEEKEPEHEAPDSCKRVPGLEGVQTIAISGDGSTVYAFGSSSAVSFSRNPGTGDLTEIACASDSDSRCAPLPDLSDVEAAAVSPDGSDVYVVTSNDKAVLAFGIGAAVTSTTAATTEVGIARVTVACPERMSRPCGGRIAFTRVADERVAHGGHRLRRVRVAAGGSGPFAIAPGRRAVVAVRLDSSARNALRGGTRLRVTATVHGERSDGGSGFGRRVALRLSRR